MGHRVTSKEGERYMKYLPYGTPPFSLLERGEEKKKIFL
jgi:hypothetical protein